MSIWVQETYVALNDDGTPSHLIGESPKIECGDETPGSIFHAYQGNKEFGGRCTSKVYIDKDGEVVHVGWVFLSRLQYEDSPETYLREAWVTLYEKPDSVVTTEYPLAIGSA